MKQFLRNNGGLLVVAAVLLAGVLTVGAYILGFDPLSRALELLATPFRAASSAVTGWTQERYDRSFRYDELEAENETLRQRLAVAQSPHRECRGGSMRGRGGGSSGRCRRMCP